MKESRYYLKRLTSAEAESETNNVHEIYVRLPNDFDYESFFQNKGFENEKGIIEIDFKATDVTFNNQSEIYDLRFVYYKNSNREKRIPSLSKIFASRGVMVGDVVCLESRTIDEDTSFYISFNRNNDFLQSSDQLYYSVKTECQSQIELYKTLPIDKRINAFEYYITNLEDRTIGPDQITKYSKIYVKHIDVYVKQLNGFNTLYEITSLPDYNKIAKIAAKDKAPDPNYAKAYQSCFNKYGRFLRELLSANCRIDLIKFGAVPISTSKVNSALPLQQIFYGAPGTGKSFGIDEEIKRNKYKSIRTTFHPDSDYSTFVGCYKPQMETVTVRDDRGFPVKENGQTVYKKEIVYKYSPQAFLKAYVKAWKNPKDSVVLVIEEINRGNCAQIFGDIFQLLDRNVDNYSSYPIHADEDILQYLNSEFDGLTIADADKIDAMYEDAVVEDVINGSKLLLPPNLYIWATMNTSDQSLFPIDSAFKRRWDWKYIRISEGRDKKTGALIKNTIKVDDAHSYDWWEFLKAINTAIGNTTMSEDKKLGFFFCKATNNVIDAELFVAKVVFYLWNDVFKDADTDLFNVLDDGNEPTFDQFYTEDTITGNTIVNKDVVVKFIEKVMKSVE